MSAKAHWDTVYANKPPNAFSWYRLHLETSLTLIERAMGDKSASVIDVGGSESTFVDDLLARGYQNITVLRCIADCNRCDQGTAAITGDIIKIQLAPRAYHLWHDRAVFRFLTSREARRAYVKNVARAVGRGGHVIVSTCAIRRRIAGGT